MACNKSLMTNRRCQLPLRASRKFGRDVYAPGLLSAAVAYLNCSAMKATITSLLLIMAALTFATFAGPAAKPTSGVGIPGFAYIRDAKLFKSEKSKDLTPEARRALRFAKGIMALRLEADIRGTFSVAQAAWGYQVNFSRLEVNKAGVWTEVSEGFGEVFLSKGLDKIEVDYGP